MKAESIFRHRNRGWGLAALAFLAFAFSAVTLFRLQRSTAAARVTISSTINEGQRNEILAKFVQLAAPHGLMLRPVQIADASELLARVDSGALDLGVVPGGIDFSRYPNIRQVTSLQVLPLHVLVKEEIADEVTTHLGALRGKSVNLGPGEGSITYWLAREVLAFAGLSPGARGRPGDYRATSLSPLQLVAESDRARLPDAFFYATPLPSPIVSHLVQRRYRLVPLLFRDAFALGAMADSLREPVREPAGTGRSPPKSDEHPIILREQVSDIVIPAFTYQADPGVPPVPLHTLGMKALLIANHRVERAVVSRVLAAIFQTRFAKIIQPPLDVHRLEEVPEIPWHPGSVEYLDLSKPVLTNEFLSKLVDLFSIAGPILGGVLFLWQYARRRTRFRNERSFEAYIAKVNAVEEAALEHARNDHGPLDEAELERLWSALSQLKTQALGRFARGEITGEAMLTSFLTHVNDTRAHLAHLIDGRRAGHDASRPVEPTLPEGIGS
jgi:TRAP-type uncharacterized transport system substrate-binding protein